MEFLAAILLVLAVVWFLRRRRSRSTQTAVPPPEPPVPPTATRSRPTATTPTRHPVPRQETYRPSAPSAASKSGELFSYAALGRGAGRYQHDGPFAVIDVETTGFSPAKGDRVIEIAVARVDASGRIEDEYSTLINPEGRDTGAVFIHRITNDMVRDAPLFSDVYGEILARLEGAVVVAHNATFEERFLAAELGNVGVQPTSLPALCSLWLGRQTFDTPNHKLGTLAQHAGIPMHDAHAALGDVRAVARLLPRMLEQHGPDLRYRCQPGIGLRSGVSVASRRAVTRAVNLRKGEEGWMSSLLTRLPMSGHEFDDATATTYLDALAGALADGKIVGDEAKMLARIAGSAGMGAMQVAALNERFLELMRDVALSDGVLTADELRQLDLASTALGVPSYFDDLEPTAVAAAPAALATAPRPAARPVSTGGAVSQRRCGHCRMPGHYRPRCPELV